MKTDPIIAEVRHARDVLAAKFNYDVAAIVRDAQKRQKQSKLKVVSLKPRKGTWPNHALQRTRPSRPGCNRGVPRAGSLSLGR